MLSFVPISYCRQVIFLTDDGLLEFDRPIYIIEYIIKYDIYYRMILIGILLIS